MLRWGAILNLERFQAQPKWDMSVNGSFDPREEAAGLDKFQQMVESYPIQGLKLYTAEWRGDSKGWRLNDPWAYRYLERCEQLGIKNLHVHKGPTIYPLSRDAFDVHDVDYIEVPGGDHVNVAFQNMPKIIEFFNEHQRKD